MNVRYSQIKSIFQGQRLGFLVATLIFIFALFVSSHPMGIYAWDAAGLLMLAFLPVRRLFDWCAMLILLWAATYFCFDSMSQVSAGSMRLALIFVPFAVYIMGKQVVRALRYQPGLIAPYLVAVIAAFSALLWFFGCLSIARNGLVSSNRTLIDLSNPTSFFIDTPATLYGLTAAVGLAGFAFFFANLGSGRKISATDIALLVAGALSLAVTVHLVNRTGLGIAIAALMALTLYRTRRNAALTVLIFALVYVALALALNYLDPKQEVVAAYSTRMEAPEANIDMFGGRGIRWADAILRAFYMPTGWYGFEDFTGYYYVHNWWLDVARVAGLASFALLVAATCISVRSVIRLFYRPDDALCALLIGLNVCLFLAAFMEPVMEGYVFFAFLYFFVWGVQNEYAAHWKASSK